jgi:hypothetical protein
MRDALTIVIVHISRQQGQPLLNVRQQLRLKAGADFFQRVNEPRHFVRPGSAGEPCRGSNDSENGRGASRSRPDINGRHHRRAVSPNSPRSPTMIWSLFGWIRQMNIGIQAVTWSGSMTLVGLLVSACVSSDRATSSATARSGAPWAQNLSEAPPSREPVSDTAARLGAELTAARERASR